MERGSACHFAALHDQMDRWSNRGAPTAARDEMQHEEGVHPDNQSGRFVVLAKHANGPHGFVRAERGTRLLPVIRIGQFARFAALAANLA